LAFRDINNTKISLVGGKGANLGELSRIEGIQGSDGFCVTAEAYKKIIGHNKKLESLLDELSCLGSKDWEKISEISKNIRKVIEQAPISGDIEEEVAHHLSALGKDYPYAVRSSATAEDLPAASFAGQHDTYLNIIGREAILKHISKCWASLFTDRAVTYRLQNGFDHRKVSMSVVVQKMVFPQAAGILFTPIPSCPIEKCHPLMPASDFVMPWSPAW
jgi:pyruvate,water dikinase